MRPVLTIGRRGKPNSFTLVELLTVILIISILAALTLMAGQGVMTQAARSRTRAEIQAMGSALENYKIDNGIYPAYNIGLNQSSYSSVDGSAAGNYRTSSQFLYQTLSGGQTNFSDTPAPGTKAYMSLKANQVDNLTAGTYVEDPFGYSYAYNTGDPVVAPASQSSPPYNGTGFYDLWSTGGSLSTTTPSPTNTWISNWTQ